MNNVFRYYAKMYNAIKESKSKTNSQNAKDIADRMMKDMEDCAHSGVALFGGDLVGVWKYLIKNNNVWDRDSYFEKVVPPAMSPLSAGGYVIPIGIIAFEEALAKRAQTVSTDLQSVFGERGVTQYQRNLKAMKTKDDWEGIGKNLGNLNKVITNGDKIWTAVIGTKIPGTYVKTITNWIEMGGYVHKFCDGYMKWERKGFQDPKLEGVCVEIAATLIDKFVPVFGSAYADVIRGVPKAAAFYSKMRTRMDDAIEWSDPARR